MYSRWFEVTVVLLWLATMSWLVTQKILPPILTGRPPNYRTIIEARRLEPPVGWTMFWNDRPIGWALNTTVRQPHRLTEIRGRVHFNELPLEEMVPAWLGAFFDLLEQPDLNVAMGNVAMDVESTLVIDPLGRLSQLESSVRLDQFEEVIKVEGTVEGAKLMLSVRSGEFCYTTEAPISSNGLLGDSLSPETKLPGLRVGQTWKLRTFSPLVSRGSPLEILEATVERVEPIVWCGRSLDASVVVYRSAQGFALSSPRSHRGKVWVDRDGTVLQQEVIVFNSKMTFVRMSDEKAAALVRKTDTKRKAESGRGKAESGKRNENRLPFPTSDFRPPTSDLRLPTSDLRLRKGGSISGDD